MAKKVGLEPPIPYVEPKGKDRFWFPDPWDEFLPSSPGFISDFVAHTRGYEVPTAYALWTAISFLAATIKREAWLEWGYKQLFSNFYVLLVGPPAMKKGTAMNLMLPIFEGCRSHLGDHNFSEIKRFNIIRDKASPEYLVNQMAEFAKKHGRYYDYTDAKGQPLLIKGKPIRYFRTAEVMIVVNELATMMGKSDYNRSMIDILLAIYDTLDRWDTGTIKRGKESLPRLCTNLLGGITPKAMQSSIPETAMEDGFLSRCSLVYQISTSRVYPVPQMAGPSLEEMQIRLAWIARNSIGLQVLSKEAFSVYDHWYRDWKKAQDDTFVHQFASSRMGVQILQLAMILKASRYSQANVIEEVDVRDAIRIITATVDTHRDLFNRVDSNAFWDKLSTLEEYLHKKGSVPRRQLLTNSKITSEELNALVSHLQQSGKIRIMRGGEESSYVSKDGKEVYKWIRNGADERRKGTQGKEDPS
jgi:hypothetical protein